MNLIVSKILGRASDLAEVEPTIALFLGAALFAVFLVTLLKPSVAATPSSRSGLTHPLGDEASPPPSDAIRGPSLLWSIYRQLLRLSWALLMLALLVGAISVLRNYLGHSLANFQRTHGRVTQANYDAVQTIWGAEQTQGELNVAIYHDEEITQRIESEDPDKPARLKKTTVKKFVTGNPFVSARHHVTLKQNPRKKGSAFYGGYETDCSFAWQLRNPSDAEQKIILTFPLPAAGAMYDALVATLDGKDVLPEIQIKDASLVLERIVAAQENLDFKIAFKSRGLSTWDFQVREPREVRDFTLTLNLPDLPKAKVNYPEGCMTPQEIASTKDGQGSVLTFRLDHALTDKGMGIALPQLAQPGETTRAVLNQTEDAWLLVFAALALTLAIGAVPHAVLLLVLFATATAFGYGLLADFSDLLFGFWGTCALVVLPLFVFYAWLLKRFVPFAGTSLAIFFLLIGIVYPCLAGLDPMRQSLYLNLCALSVLLFVGWRLAKGLSLKSAKGDLNTFPSQNESASAA